jgi:hypothetical protein
LYNNVHKELKQKPDSPEKKRPAEKIEDVTNKKKMKKA